jgi:hypothetical protein
MKMAENARRRNFIVPAGYPTAECPGPNATRGAAEGASRDRWG